MVNVRSGEREIKRVKIEAIVGGRETKEEGGTIKSRGKREHRRTKA